MELSSARTNFQADNRICKFICQYTYPKCLTAPSYNSYYIDPDDTHSQKIRSNYGDVTAFSYYSGEMLTGVQVYAGASVTWRSPILNGIYKKEIYTGDSGSRRRRDDWYYYLTDTITNNTWSATYYFGHEIDLTNQ